MAEQALLATHGDPLVGRALVRTISSKFSVEHVFNLEQMLVHCRQREYGLYVMDLNLGYEAALNIIPAQTIYALLQERGIEKLEKKFIGVSGASDVIEVAQEEGLPAVLKTEFLDYFRRLFPR